VEHLLHLCSTFENYAVLRYYVLLHLPLDSCVYVARMNKKKEQEESGTCVECGAVYRHASDPKKQEEWNVVPDL